jgi:exopolysaccharide biosynthesis protein
MVRLLKTGAGLALAAVFALAPTPVHADDPCKEGFESAEKKVAQAVVLHTQHCENPPYRSFILEVDLTSKKIGFLVTPYKKRRLVTSAFAEQFDAVAAVNGGFWSDKGGFTVSDGELWPKFPDTEEAAVVGFGDYDPASGAVAVDIRPPEEVLTDVPGWMKQALSGMPLLLEGGEPQSNDGEIFKTRHPRTGIGYTKDGKTLFIAVVDGRQKGWSLGLRTEQFGRLFASLGAWRALNLDGGQSSTMVIPSMGGVVNRPCFKKGPERNVPNHLAIVKVKKSKTAVLLEKILRPFAAGGLWSMFFS